MLDTTNRIGSTEPTTTTCHCGQDLDVCSRQHCPRCGVTLKPLALAA